MLMLCWWHSVNTYFGWYWVSKCHIDVTFSFRFGVDKALRIKIELILRKDPTLPENWTRVKISHRSPVASPRPSYPSGLPPTDSISSMKVDGFLIHFPVRWILPQLSSYQLPLWHTSVGSFIWSRGTNFSILYFPPNLQSPIVFRVLNTSPLWYRCGHRVSKHYVFISMKKNL